MQDDFLCSEASSYPCNNVMLLRVLQELFEVKNKIFFIIVSKKNILLRL
jgi:hypothetical protein